MIRILQDSDHEAVAALMGGLPEWFTPDAVQHFRIDLRYHRGFVAVDAADSSHAAQPTILGFIT